MDLPNPFAYPTTPLARRHGPQGYEDYGSYKPSLRDEFVLRCVYCLERERWYPSRGAAFSADHFVPKVIDPTRETDYDNLIYACVRCNSYKEAKIVPLDPALVAFAAHFRVKADATIEGLTVEARDPIDLLDLNHPPALEVRRFALNLLELKKAQPRNGLVDRVFRGSFGYPSDLPDLNQLKPPSGNSRPAGIQDSHHARKLRGVLGDVY